MGEVWAWRALYDELAPSLLGYLRARGAARPEDVLGEVMLQIARDLPSFGGGAWDLRAWAFTIAHHRVLDAQSSKATRAAEPMPATPQLGSLVDPEWDVRWALSIERVGRLLARLSPDERNVILLRVVGELTCDEVANVIGKPAGTVATLERRGFETLSSELAEDGHVRSEPLADADLAGLLADVRASCLSEPDEAVASGHLDAITREAEAIVEPQRPEPDWWRRSITNRFVRRDLLP